MKIKKNNLKFIDLRGKFSFLKKGLLNDLKKLDDGNFILGDEIFGVEKKLAKISGYKYCVLVSSGTCALLAAFLSINLKRGDEIISPGFSWVSVINVAKLLGLKIKFCDISTTDFNICVNDLKKKVSRNTKAIVGASLFGLKMDIKKIQDLVKNTNIEIIEDNAQSFGENMFNLNKKKSGIMTTSFFPTKTLGCFGDLGAVFVDNKEKYQRLLEIRNHGNKKGDSVFGLNLRPQLFQALVIKNNLNNFKRELDLRREIGDRYNKIIQKKGGNWIIPDGNFKKQNIFAYYNILVNKRSKIIKELKNVGIPTKIYYHKALYDYKYLGTSSINLKNVEYVKKNILSLPMHVYNKKNMTNIFKKLKNYLN